MEFLTLPLKKFLLAGLAGLLSLSLAGNGLAQPASKTGAPGDLPLNITADQLTVEQNQQVISFINNVIARYKDVILYADILKIFYQAQASPGPGADKTGARQPAAAAPPEASKGSPASPLGAVGIEKVTRIEAQGKVRMVQGDRVATGDKAIFYTQDDKIVLTGNPQLWRGENSLKGREIVFFLKENRAVVEGDPKKRVEAIIYPSQKIQLPGQPRTEAP